MDNSLVDDAATINSRKRKHFRRHVPNPDHNLAQRFKNEYLHQKTKLAKLSVKEEIDKLCDVSIIPSLVTSLDVADTIKVGSDCTGLGTELLALRLAKIDHVAVFGSELHETTRQIYYGLHGDKAKLYFDIF